MIRRPIAEGCSPSETNSRASHFKFLQDFYSRVRHALDVGNEVLGIDSTDQTSPGSPGPALPQFTPLSLVGLASRLRRPTLHGSQQ